MLDLLILQKMERKVSQGIRLSFSLIFISYLLNEEVFRCLSIRATENTERSKGKIIKAGNSGNGLLHSFPISR
jgi:hypothetical protein